MKSTKRTLQFIMVLGLTGLLASHTFAGSPPKILLVNSDATVEKYQIPQKTFQQTLSFPVVLVNLGEKKWRLHEVEELVYDEDPDLIYTIGSKAFLMVHKFAGKTPIVFSSAVNWLRLPVTKHTYGVSNELHSGMEIMLFRYMFPHVQKIGLLYSWKYTGKWFKHAQKQAEDMEMALVGEEIAEDSDVLENLRALRHEIDVFWLIPDPVLLKDKERLINILKVCDSLKLPVFSYHKAFIPFGVLFSVSVDIPTIGRQAAGIATQLLADERPEESVQFPAGSYIILNLKKAQEYGVSYNEEALDSVNTIIR
ncbi:hypothetical protein CSA56_18375 [candidate division KSB3 bacterium]|uniref:ABC transporter substrate-binding protein n=1 Tax=candidate division KSB3 bacterium TaxID=2044937 RepID=A0A2G6K6Y7_9BACT|nr:MAG: hypothetical protein CSA56_18375 [candidate division KSB3 bacterium]